MFPDSGWCWFSRLLLDFGLDVSLVVVGILVHCVCCVFGFLASCIWHGVGIIYGLLRVVIVGALVVL